MLILGCSTHCYLSGAVVDEDGAAIPNAGLFYTFDPSTPKQFLTPNVVTDEAGLFDDGLMMRPGERSHLLHLWVFKEGYIPGGPLIFDSGEHPPIKIVLKGLPNDDL